MKLLAAAAGLRCFSDIELSSMAFDFLKASVLLRRTCCFGIVTALKGRACQS